MSAFDSFVIRPRCWVWNLLLLLLLLLLRAILIPVLWLILIVLGNTVHTILSILAIGSIIESCSVVVGTTSEILITTTTWWITATSSSEVSILTVRSSHWLSSPHVIFVLLLRLSRSLIAVLILDAFLGQSQLFWSEWISWLSKLLFSMSKVALFFQKTIFMGDPMSAKFCFVFLIELFSLFLSCSSNIWVILVHWHLVVHHILLRESNLTSVLWHHVHHLLWIVELVWHLAVLTLQALHWVKAHVGLHPIHLVLLHGICSVHIENKRF